MHTHAKGSPTKGAPTRIDASTCQGPKKLPNMAIPAPLYAATELPKMAISRPYSPLDRHIWQFLGTLAGANSKSVPDCAYGSPLVVSAYQWNALICICVHQFVCICVRLGRVWKDNGQCLFLLPLARSESPLPHMLTQATAYL